MNPRGPYSRIRWYCNDGSVQPPVAYACRERGGGRQHAEYSAERQRLASLGWNVGTIFVALSYEELFDAERRHQRLREIPLERYMIDTNDGWVLHRARDYRGRVQVENEVVAGRALLLRLLDDPVWALNHFLLLREAARSIPHGEDTDLTRSVRRNAIVLAEIDRSAEKWRAEIHSDPDAETATRLRRWAGQLATGEARTLAFKLADDLDALYGPAGRRSRIDSALIAVGPGQAAGRFRAEVAAAIDKPPMHRISALCSAMAAVRSEYFADLPAPQRLAIIDAMRELEVEAQLAFQDVDVDALSRNDVLALGQALLKCAYSSGLLSARELSAVGQHLAFKDKGTVTLDEYRAAVNWMKRTPGWALGTIRHTFAEPLTRYTALDSRAARFSDDLLRGSPMWMLGDVLKTLSKDVDLVSGSVVEIAGQPIGGAVALNSGVARGTLRIFDSLEALESAELKRTDIAVVPETIAELSPIAGILTLGEGNALSHVQLLARNFGIPNVAIDYGAIEALEPLRGKRVLMIVSSAGDVLIEVDDQAAAPSSATVANTIVVPVPDLRRSQLLVLDELGRELSGKVVGPKAANLGELNRLFPGRVAPAIAVPFGVYAAHLDSAGLTSRIVAAFAAAKDGTMDETAFAAELASVRRDIAALRLAAELREQLSQLMLAQFGKPGTYGVFIRSDTNVEDLPQFTGAGLNETLPNIVKFEEQLTGIPRVWSSVLSPRALAWRSSVLANPEQIYASVLLMKSVAATKSGVLVTKNLFERETPGITVSTAWGVGGAVAGEAAETIVIKSDDVDVISEAKSPYQRHIAASGGVDLRPAPAGRVLTLDEIAQLRWLAAAVNERYEPVLDDTALPRPWDVEFGFVDGSLTLFQIRPLVERGSGSADDLLRELRPMAFKAASGATRLSLKERPRRMRQ